MMPDYPLEETLDFKFTTRAFATGVPTTLAGTPAVEIYEDNSITQITTAETLTADFDGVAGLNNLRVVATAANGFESGKSYSCVISVGTVGGVSVVGEVVAQFSIERSPALRPTTVGRTLDVTAGGTAGVDWANVESQGSTVDLSATDIQLCDTVTTNTDMRGTDSAATAAALTTHDGKLDTVDANIDTLVGRITLTGTANAGDTTVKITLTGGVASDNYYNGQLVVITGGTGIGQARSIGSYLAAGTVATPTRDWIVAPDGTSTFIVVADDVATLLEAGVAQAGGATSITFDATASSGTNIYKNNFVALTGGTGLGQTRLISAYNGTTKVATTTPAWDTNPDVTSIYQVLPMARVDVAGWLGNLVTGDGDWATLQTAVDAIPTTAMRGTDNAATEAKQDTMQTALDTVTKVGPTKAEMDTAHGLLATEAKQDIIDTVVDAIKVITDALGATAAANLALSCGASGVVTGAAIAGTLSTTQMTTDLTEATDDHYIGRVILWTGGVLAGQATDITDYTGATKLLTYTATTEAPSATDAFIIV
jgi:hypothetical protein